MKISNAHAFDRLLLEAIEISDQSAGILSTLVLRLASALRDGEVSLQLSQQEQNALVKNERLTFGPSIGQVIETPLVLHGGRLYFGRYFDDLCRLASAIARRAVTTPEKDWLPLTQTTDSLSPGQKRALELAGNHAIALVTGGPGTGKTHLIQSLVNSMGNEQQALLLAPTGKAAGRLPALEGVTVKTIHSALKLRPGDLRHPLHHSKRPFEADLVVVDEVSMVGLTLLRQVVEAVAPKARLVLIGDKDQLQSVAAGSVLGPVLQGSPALVADGEELIPLAQLKKSFRFGGTLAALALAAGRGDERAFFDVLTTQEDGVRWCEYSDARSLRAQLRTTTSQILCAHRHGSFGSEQINDFLASRPESQARPIILRRSDTKLGLFNGDVGFLETDEAYFGERRVPRALLPPFESAYALTIHQSQGSEFQSVGVVLPPSESPLLSRELLYTAITRARTGLTIFASRESLATCLKRSHSATPGLVDLILEGFRTVGSSNPP